MDCSRGDQDVWHNEEKCLAPYSENSELCEAVVKSISCGANGLSYAVISFLDSTQKKLPLSELCKPPAYNSSWNTSMFDDEDLEKPFFPDRRPHGPSENFPLSDTGVSVPYTINRYLRDYQRDGVHFLYKHFSQSVGCILGDDMGLGKTIQVISFLAAVLNKKGTREDIENNMPEFLLRTIKKASSTLSPKKVFLIVSPLSVLYNWKDELETWGYFRLTLIHGNKKDSEISRLKQGKFEVALTTYETLRLCLDEINSIDWSAVVVDEVHRIKNPKARVTQVMKEIRCKVRIGLTGTILQNNMGELWCVMDWAVPGYLGSSSQFKEKFSNPVEYGQRHNATKRELATGRKAILTLASKLSPFFLRRTKTLISQQLPKKEDRIIFCSLSEFQKAVYQTVLETQDVNLVLQGGELCSCKSGRKRRKCCYKENVYGESVRTLYFSYLAILRKVANHAALLQTDTTTSKKQEAHIKRVCNEVFSKFPEFALQSKDAAFETLSDPRYSGKMKVLQKLLNHCRKNKDKVLLFSFSTKLLDVLERYCMASGLDYRRLDGNTKAEERMKIVKEFNTMQDVNICLVSTMAGGLGLNFIGANVVVVFDPTWNPANDLQAIDRAYRIGQCRDVKVFRFVSLGTVEEMIYLRQVYKQQLQCAVVGSENAKRYFEAVQGSKEHKGELFGINNLFKLRPQGSCLTRDILEREKQVEAGVTSATMYVSQTPNTEMGSDLDSDDPKVGAKHCRRVFKESTFDFSSDSDEEANGTSVMRSNKTPSNTDNRKQITLQQCGFSKMLEKEITDKKISLPEESNMSILNVNIKSQLSSRSVQKNKYTTDQNVVPVSEQHHSCGKSTFLGKGNVCETEYSSDESAEDVVLSSQVCKKDPMKKSSLFKCISESDYSDFDLDTSVKTNSQYIKSSCDEISDESDDIEIPKKNALKDSFLTKYGAAKDSQTIEVFTSSDDDNFQNEKTSPIYEGARRKSAKFRMNLKSKKRKNESVFQTNKAITHQEGVKHHCNSLDNVLDGVEGVAYIHSNQHVVGSSKAENQLSRWAVRDVFELKQFSQLPANITPLKMKKSEYVSDEKKPLKSEKDLATKSYTVLQYPITHQQKKVHRVSKMTFLVGETPKAMQRKQFQEMAAYFNMNSAEQFARHIASVKSDVRQNMLREYYISKYSEAGDLYPIQEQLALQDDKEHRKKEPGKLATKRRLKGINTFPDETAEKRIKSHRKTSERIATDSHGYEHLDSSSLNVPFLISHTENPQINHTRDSSATTLKITNSHGKLSSSAVNPTCSNNENKPCETSSISELLGDTSILDDLFINKTNRQTELPVKANYDPAATKAKRRPKDFWDLLNEQNDESLNKLSDLSVIEKVCQSPTLPSAAKKDHWNDSLWVNNEKFLWRKPDSMHNSSTSSDA
ncbi:DNA excision repair protein ERCC-6-like 2 [Xenopus laevis]|uniref:DNA excision repair protein ERCC-6-like 2 n=2 Tax=Xenopus laevis TaxID=8355 RepID=A0A974E1F2_XENLA|nr:DNA excision repair protein ERCC-6-like 2 [Xenopus laevis]OCU01172.1 hypothetical protein XELAEV_18006958mg [Xenopus laevis]